jgi:hypothetical protein
MKLSISKFIVVGIISSSIGCNDNSDETVSSIPLIESATVAFVEPPDRPGWNIPDTVNLTIDFTDRDFDLGFDYKVMEDRQFPYHYCDYFINGSSGIEKIAPTIIEVPKIGYMDYLKSDKIGKLITFGNIKQAISEPPPLNCVDYEFATLFVDGALIDSSYNTTDNIGNDYLVIDTLYRQLNENHYNIKVDFLVENSGGYELYDWQKEFCTTFNGRFPLVNNPNDFGVGQGGPFKFKRKSKSKGQLKYSMTSHGFKILFQGKNLKLRVTITDRSLNKSNAFETEPIVIP